jgi:hypothetical protein
LALPCSSRRTRLPGDIDSGIASQVGLVVALEIVMARIDVPSLSFLFGLNVALFALMGLGLALALHFGIPPFFIAAFRFRPDLIPGKMGMLLLWRKGRCSIFLGWVINTA